MVTVPVSSPWSAPAMPSEFNLMSAPGSVPAVPAANAASALTATAASFAAASSAAASLASTSSILFAKTSETTDCARWCAQRAGERGQVLRSSRNHPWSGPRLGQIFKRDDQSRGVSATQLGRAPWQQRNGSKEANAVSTVRKRATPRIAAGIRPAGECPAFVWCRHLARIAYPLLVAWLEGRGSGLKLAWTAM